MVEIIRAKNLLTIILSKTESVSCETVVNIRNSIEKKYPDIIIDITRNSVIRAQKRYPYLFKLILDDDKIQQAKPFFTLPSMYLRNEFFNSIDENIFKKNR